MEVLDNQHDTIWRPLRKRVCRTVVRMRLIIIFCASILSFSPLHADSSLPSLEYQIKASLVFNFLNFVEWPETQSEFKICHFGTNRYGRALGVLQGEVVQGRRVNVDLSHQWSVEVAETCHVAIFTEHNRATIKEWQRSIASKAILTVGESDGFLEDGGIIRLILVNDTVQFEINLNQAKLSRLTISTKLLRLAHRVFA